MSNREQILKEAYRCMAELWCSPRDVDGEKLKKEAEEVIQKLNKMDAKTASLLESFLKENCVSEEEYVDLFELNPKCPLYLGSHVYEEPKTCAQAGVSDRNDYMIELLGVYKHFGWSPDGKELPDYLPSVIEFLALTAESGEDPIRKKLIVEYILPFLPPLRSRLEELKTPYLYLLKACEGILHLDCPGGGLESGISE